MHARVRNKIKTEIIFHSSLIKKDIPSPYTFATSYFDRK